MRNKLIVIVYNGGAYGTYLEWLLRTMFTHVPIVSPLTAKGSSHDLAGDHGTMTMESWRGSTISQGFCRLHPKTHGDDSIKQAVEEIAERAYRVLAIAPDENSILLNLNNAHSKIWKDWFEWKLSNDIDPVTFYKNWPVPEGTAAENIPVWVKREFLSLYLMPAWRSEVDWGVKDSYQHAKCKTVTINELLYSTEQLLDDVASFCHLHPTRSFSSMSHVHQAMLGKQQYLEQDSICQRAVESIVSQVEYEWGELPLVSQSWIQWELRNRGLSLKCHGLDQFPTSTTGILPLLETI